MSNAPKTCIGVQEDGRRGPVVSSSSVVSPTATTVIMEESARSMVQMDEPDVPAARPRPKRRQSSFESESPPRSAKEKLFREIQPRLVLENSGSVARDHLASERTFLAYVRTSLAVSTTGVALVQLFTIAVNASQEVPAGVTFSSSTHQMQMYARPLGATVVVLGLGVLVIGVMRYFTVQVALTRGKFPVARWLTAGIAFSLGTIIAVVFGVLVAGKK